VQYRQFCDSEDDDGCGCWLSVIHRVIVGFMCRSKWCYENRGGKIFKKRVTTVSTASFSPTTEEGWEPVESVYVGY
jgi:hypothetical protein